MLYICSTPSLTLAMSRDYSGFIAKLGSVWDYNLHYISWLGLESHYQAWINSEFVILSLFVINPI